MRDEIRWFLRRSFLMERNLELQKGLTLMELMITIAIIGILAAIAIPNFLGYRTKARIARAKAELKTIEFAIQALAVDTWLWPTEGDPKNPANVCTGDDEIYNLGSPEAGLVATDGHYPGWYGPYIKSIPKDPWGNDYFWDPDYKIDGDDYVAIASYGPNGTGLNDDDNIYIILAAPEEPDDSQTTDSISWDQAMAFDANGDGHLYEAEFESLMRHYSPDLSDQEISDLFDDMDTNNTGRVGDNEYTPVW